MASNNPRTRSVVPAFFLIDLPAHLADEVAAETCSTLNKEMATLLHPSQPRFVLRLCEASSTTEIDDPNDSRDPTTLEGLTCESGSDRSATATIRKVSELLHSGRWGSTGAAQQVVDGWLAQRMALHPHASTDAAPCAEALHPAIAALGRQRDALVEALDNCTASLETCMAHYGQQMPAADQHGRERVIAEARTLIQAVRP